MISFLKRSHGYHSEKRIKELEDRIRVLENDLIHDPLTGLKTRRYFEQEAATYTNIVVQSFEAFQRQEWFGFKQLSFVFFDIDHFKKINDTYGHKIGDVVLKEVARTIQDSVREGDIVARWGGEEITLMLVGAEQEEAVKKADEIRQSVSELLFESGGDKFSVTTSAGVASLDPLSEDRDTYEKVVEKADQALYRAKHGGRNRVEN